jgi:nucleoside-diphosphate-sugar epimerase
LEVLETVNVTGSRRVFEAVEEAEVPALVYASSVGAYSEGPRDRAVDESRPTDRVASSYYGRQKAAVERILDTFEQRAPHVRVVRLRPGLIFKSQAASEIRRLFLGPFLPSPPIPSSISRGWPTSSERAPCGFSQERCGPRWT